MNIKFNIEQIKRNYILFFKLLSLKSFNYNITSIDTLYKSVNGIFPPIAFIYDLSVLNKKTKHWFFLYI